MLCAGSSSLCILMACNDFFKEEGKGGELQMSQDRPVHSPKSRRGIGPCVKLKVVEVSHNTAFTVDVLCL